MIQFNFNEQDFLIVKEKAEAFYSEITEVYCPYFKEKIAFNTKGIKHLKFKTDKHARKENDQYARFKLLHLAPEIVNMSHTLQGLWHTKQFVLEKTNSRSENVLKDVSMYEFIAVIRNLRVKVIIKEVFGREKYFWSIIPFWKVSNKTAKRMLYSGDPETD
ncbi:MAG: hypothetical protein WC629_01815 [Candidatus Paceibacterota bacterium]|jgi:hypothetical protein